jgi:hypothetical protein
VVASINAHLFREIQIYGNDTTVSELASELGRPETGRL